MIKKILILQCGFIIGTFISYLIFTTPLVWLVHNYIILTLGSLCGLLTYKIKL
jgi:hypothetical protein